MKSQTILDSRLFVRLDLDHSLKANSLFQTEPANRGHLGAQLLLYEKILIPTNDFGIVPILINWLGLSTFRAAIEASAFGFVRQRGSIGYAGNGVGLCPFEITTSTDGLSTEGMEWWQTARFGDESTALDAQLAVMCPFVGRAERARLIEDVLSPTTSFDIAGSEFHANVARETYEDIMRDPVLSARVFEMAGGHLGRLNLPRLPGVAANMVRTCSLKGPRDAVDLLLNIAEINLQLLMSRSDAGIDMLTPVGAEEILKAKLRRFGVAREYVEGLSKLLELNGLPDLRVAVADGAISLSDVWHIRTSRASTAFRKWLSEAEAKDARDIEKLYVASIGEKSWIDSLPSRVIRFVLVTAAGVLNPVIGAVGGAVDSFFVNRWLNGYSPRLLFDELRSLGLERKT